MKPTPAPAIAQPVVAVAPPVVQPVPSAPPSVPTPEVFDDPYRPLVRVNRRRPGVRWDKLIWALVALLLAVGIVGAGGYYIFFHVFEFNNTSSADGPVVKKPMHHYVISIPNTKKTTEKACKVSLDLKEWKEDVLAKDQFGANGAWKQIKADAFFAVVVRDYGLQRPRDLEFVRTAVEKLELRYGVDLELAERAEPTKFGDRDAQQLKFRGHYSGGIWNGAIYYFFDSGFAYWVIISTPDDARIPQIASDLAKTSVQVAHERRGWREQPPKLLTFTAESKRFTLTGEEGMWEASDARAEDDLGDLGLVGRYLREKDNSKNAVLLGVKLPPEKDRNAALEQAVAHFTKEKIKENPDYRVAPLNDRGDPTRLNRGACSEHAVELNGEKMRFWVVGVVQTGDANYAFRCDANWRNHQIWRQEFVDLLNTFKVTAAE